VTIAVYGANGYQGKLVTAELARQDLDLVMVGRDLTRLQDAAKASGVPDTELRQAATDDPTALAAAFRGVDVVINCAGPFTNSGVAVVRAAVEAGCHYLDTAGEQLYLQRIFDTVSPEAERAGVTVVPAMTDGGVPGDLIAHLLAERLGPLEELTTAHLITGNGEPPSRGSLRSGLVTLADLRQGGLRYADGVWTSGTPAGRTVMTFPGSAESPGMSAFGGSWGWSRSRWQPGCPEASVPTWSMACRRDRLPRVGAANASRCWSRPSASPGGMFVEW